MNGLAEQEPEPAVPEAEYAGPWRVVKLHGDGDPVWAVYVCGERRSALSFEEPDLAYLAAAALAVAERPTRFGMLADGAGTVHVRQDGRTVGTAVIAGDSLPVDLTRLAELRVQSLALAHLLRAVPEGVLRRTGAILASMAHGRKWSRLQSRLRSPGGRSTGPPGRSLSGRHRRERHATCRGRPFRPPRPTA